MESSTKGDKIYEERDVRSVRRNTAQTEVKSVGKNIPQMEVRPVRRNTAQREVRSSNGK